MSWAAVAIGGASVVSGMMGSSSAKKAAAAQAAAIREATALKKQMWETGREDLTGYRDLGAQGLDGLSKNDKHLQTFQAGDMQKDPGYQFRMDEGQKALERSAAARGGSMGSSALKALTRYGQDYGSQEYGNAYSRFNNDRDQRFNKLMGMVKVGQSSATNSASMGQNYANSAGADIIGGGNAQGASQIAQGNAWSNAIGSGISAYGSAGGFGSTSPTGGSTQAQKAQGFSDVFSGSGEARQLPSVSDARLKSDAIKLDRSIYKDFPTYSFKYIDEKYGKGWQTGVMAQDLLASDSKHPAVSVMDDGFYQVDYSKLEVL